MRFLLAATIFILLNLVSMGRADELELQFPAQPDSVRMAVRVLVDGQPPEARWHAFLDALFDFLDRDGNGKLDRAEFGRAFDLPLPDGKLVHLDFDKADADKNGAVSRDELINFVRSAGFRPMVVKVVQSPPEQRRLGDILFQELDRNRDGVLTAGELAAAPRLLRRFDENEDEVIQPAELLVMNSVSKPISGTPINVVHRSGDSDATARLRVALDRQAHVSLEAGNSNVFRVDGPGAESGTTRISFPEGICLIASSVEDRVAGFKSVRGFYQAQFKSASGSKSGISKQDLERDLGLRSLASLFGSADRNGDGMLSLVELNRFLDLLELGVGSQITLILEDCGRNLFDLLDVDQNRELDSSELIGASKLLRLIEGGEKQSLSAQSLPNLYRLRAVRGTVSSTFGHLMIASKARPTTVAATRQDGPAWFRAMDRNGDGFVSPREFLGPPELFRKLDANGDGRISPEEAAQARPKEPGAPTARGSTSTTLKPR